ncbi:hypothetical protein OH77DRAFT_1436969 [Trametes cingulata]|nr:hypothetical protein OH77DRAFT_1436969 [Trametes cingulata]
MIMKAAIAVLSSAALAFAQSITVPLPPPRSTLTPGSAFVVEVNRDVDSAVPSRDVSVAIGLESCGQAQCGALASEGMLGTVLYAGDYAPQPQPGNSSQLSEQFNASVPAGMQAGDALLNVAHFYLDGADGVDMCRRERVLL